MLDRPGTWLCAGVFVVSLSAPRTASAECATDKQLDQVEVPVDCPVTYYLREGTTVDMPRASRFRLAHWVDVSSTVEGVPTMLDVTYNQLECAAEPTAVRSEPYTKFTFAVTGTLEADKLAIRNAARDVVSPEILVVASTGTCPTISAPMFSCDVVGCGAMGEPEPPIEEPDDDSGCAASGGRNGVGGALAFAVLAIVRRRRR